MTRTKSELYALLDFESLIKRDLGFDDFFKLIKKLKIRIVQYRDKVNSKQEIRNNILYIRNIYEDLLIINDYYEFVNLCDGVHLGQDDILKIDENKMEAVKKIRELSLKKKIIGISTHNKKEIKEANSFDVDYVGLGSYRNTNTKKDAKVIKSDINELISLSKKDVALIGGVKVEDKVNGVRYLVIGSNLYEYI